MSSQKLVIVEPESAWTLAKNEILGDPTLSDGERNILTTCTIDGVVSELKTLDNDHAIKSKSRKVMHFLEPVLQGLQKYSPAMDVLSQADSLGILTLVWGSIRILLTVARGFNKYFDELVEFLRDVAAPIGRLEAYGLLIPQSERLQVALRNVFVSFLRFTNRTRRMFIDHSNQTNKTTLGFTRSGIVFKKNIWKDFGAEVEREVTRITNMCEDAEKEAKLAVSQTTVETQAAQGLKVEDAFAKADSAYLKQDIAHGTIIGHQRRQIDHAVVESSLASTERSRQELERHASEQERVRQGLERHASEQQRMEDAEQARLAKIERERQEQERKEQAEERAAAAEERERRAKQLEEDKHANAQALMKEIVDWLSPVNAPEVFRELREQRMKGTCDWILQNSTYKQWIEAPLVEGQPRILWINAIPGAGKTFLCTRIVEALQEQNEHVAIFYCDTKDDKKRKLENILRSWAWQLLLQCPGKITNVAELYRSGKQADAQLFIDAVKAFLTTDEQRILVLDALDECEPKVRIEILKLLSQFSNAKMLITSRKESDITRGMERAGSAVVRITIEIADNAQDIKHYLKEKVHEMKIEDKDLEYRVATELFDAADGMFLYARWMINDLSEKDMDSEIEDALNDLPSGLPEIYGRILSRIDDFPKESKKEHARILLKWICAATEPLTLDEMRDITAFNLDGDEDFLNPRNRLRSVESLINDCCGPLVEIGVYDQKIRISHASVKDYLLSRARTGDATYFVDLEEAHNLLARCCLAYLSYSSIELVDVDSDREASLTRLDTFYNAKGLLQYAILHWWRHYLHLASDPTPDLRRKFKKFATSNFHGTKWLQAFHHLRGDRTSGWHPGQNDYIILLERLVQIRENWEETSDERTWLHELDLTKKYLRFYCLLTCYNMAPYPAIGIAAMFNFTDVIERELARGVHVDMTNWRGESPLLLAARGNAPEAVTTLLKHGANPSHVGDQTENALHRAISAYGLSEPSIIRNIHYDTVPLLLNAGCDVHLKNFAGDTVTHYIARGEFSLPGLVRVMELVLDAGGQDDINSRNNEGRTPLDLAAWRGIKDIARVLLDNGANIDDGNLIEASRKSDPDLATMLIDYKANVNAVDRWQNTPIKEAVIRDGPLVRRLLEAGADPNIPDEAGLYPVHHAAIEGSHGAISLLGEYGAHLDVKTIDGQTALDLAITNKRESSIDLLTKLGAKRTTKDDSAAPLEDLYPKTEKDILCMYSTLKTLTRSQLKRSIILHILDVAGYWVQSTTEREDYLIITQDEEEPGIGFLPYIISPAVTGLDPNPVKKIVISTYSHDQGFSSYPQHQKSYNDSWTGFRLRLRRTAKSAMLRSEQFAIQGKDENEIRKTLAQEEYHIQCNRHGWWEAKWHVNTWSQNGHESDLIGSIRNGDVLEVVPWALYPCWQNHILAVKLDVFTSYLH